MSHIDESLLQAYIDGFCDAAESATIERHVEECQACRARLEEARAAMSRASELLGALEPGPIHAPAFEELAARAAGRQGDSTDGTPVSDSADAASTDGRADVPVATPSTPAPVISLPFWRRPSLAWAATLVLAFGLGWLSRSELGLPIGMESGLFDQPETSVKAYRPQSAEQEAAGAETAAEPEEAPADTDVAEVEFDDRAEADPQAAGTPRGAPAASADALMRKTRDEEVAQVPPPAAGPPVERRANQPLVAGEAGRAAEPAPQRQLELNEQVGAVMFAREGGAGGYLSVPLDEAEAWLGAAPRQLPEFRLVRAEVGPGSLMPGGVVGLPAVRLVYQDPSGQEIALVQQYLGALDAKEEAKQTTAADRIAPARAGERSEQPRAESRLRADAAVGADLDYFAVVGGLADLPVSDIDDAGLNRRRWVDVDGYLLSLSGPVPADILVGLADRIR